MYTHHIYIYIYTYYKENNFIIVAMIDSVGGPQRMNNLLTTLNLPSINDRSLKVSMLITFLFTKCNPGCGGGGGRGYDRREGKLNVKCHVQFFNKLQYF